LNPKENISTKNIAFINFYKPESALKSKQAMENKLISGQHIKIKWGNKIKTCNPRLESQIKNHINVIEPEDKKIKKIINKISKIVAEVILF